MSANKFLGAIVADDYVQIIFAPNYAAIPQPRYFYRMGRYRTNRGNPLTQLLLRVTTNANNIISGWVADINLISDPDVRLNSKPLLEKQTKELPIGYEYITKVYEVVKIDNSERPTTPDSFAYGVDWTYASYAKHKLIIG